MKVQPFKTLLFGFAFSPSLKANVYEAMRLAYFLNARLVFVHVGEKKKQNNLDGVRSKFKYLRSNFTLLRE